MPDVIKARFISFLCIPLWFLFSPLVLTHVQDVHPPDLVIDRLTCSPSSPLVGESVRVNVMVKNKGEGAYRGDLVVTLFINGKKGPFCSTDASLASGASMPFTFRVPMPKVPGKVILSVCVKGSREPKNKGGNNSRACVLEVLKRNKETEGKGQGESLWQLMGVKPGRLVLDRSEERKMEAWFRGGAHSSGKIKISMVLQGGGERQSFPGKVSWVGELIKVTFSLDGGAFPPGFYGGKLVLETRGQKKFFRGPVVVVREGRGRESKDWEPDKALLIFPAREGLEERLVFQVGKEGGRVLKRVWLKLLKKVVLLVTLPHEEKFQVWKTRVERLYPGVKVERNRLFKVLSGKGDPLVKYQFYREKAGFQEYSGRLAEVRVGVVDTGYDYRHEDLEGTVEERWDAVGARGRGFSREVHGTQVLGIIAARCCNGTGICGLAPFARLFFVRACWEEKGKGQATTFALLKALDHLAEKSPHVINMSLGGGCDPLLRMALAELDRRGILLVAAASRVRGKESFPAAFPFVLGVGGLDSRGVPMENVMADVWAPGENIFTTYPGDDYRFSSGASMAAAVVTGGLACLKGCFPHLSAAELRRLVVGGCKRKGGLCVFNLKRALQIVKASLEKSR